MAFQPFGYRFEILSPMPPAKAKAAIRGRKKRWFDSKQGARGWIVGPFICLWLSAYDRHGPMLVGRISAHSFGAKVSGRAGSDLNGMFVFSLLLPLLGWGAFQLAVEGEQSGQLFVLLAILLLLTPLIFWTSHKDRKQAEPLLRFVRDAVTPASQALESHLTRLTVSPLVKMTFSGEMQETPVTAQELFQALQAAMPGDFLILSTSAEEFIQTLGHDEGFILEKRDGGPDRHFKAVGSGKQLGPEGRSLFTFEETLAALVAYASNSPMPHFIRWEPMELPA